MEDDHRTLVATDIHVGLARLEAPVAEEMVGGPLYLADLLVSAARATRARRVLLLGDIKEPILGAPGFVRGELRRFLAALQGARLDIEICRGNHDVGIERVLPSGVTLYDARGLFRDGIGYFHGHAWPSRQTLEKASTLVVGHLHPGFRLAGGKVSCWVRGRPEGERPFSATEVIVLPSLNPLCSSEALNIDRPRRSRTFLVRRFLSSGEARAYLLDGTDLGRLDLGAGR